MRSTTCRSTTPSRTSEARSCTATPGIPRELIHCRWTRFSRVMVAASASPSSSLIIVASSFLTAARLCVSIVRRRTATELLRRRSSCGVVLGPMEASTCCQSIATKASCSRTLPLVTASTLNHSGTPRRDATQIVLLARSWASSAARASSSAGSRSLCSSSLQSLRTTAESMLESASCGPKAVHRSSDDHESARSSWWFTHRRSSSSGLRRRRSASSSPLPTSMRHTASGRARTDTVSVRLRFHKPQTTSSTAAGWPRVICLAVTLDGIIAPEARAADRASWAFSRAGSVAALAKKKSSWSSAAAAAAAASSSSLGAAEVSSARSSTAASPPWMAATALASLAMRTPFRAAWNRAGDSAARSRGSCDSSQPTAAAAAPSAPSTRSCPGWAAIVLLTQEVKVMTSDASASAAASGGTAPAAAAPRAGEAIGVGLLAPPAPEAASSSEAAGSVQRLSPVVALNQYGLFVTGSTSLLHAEASGAT
mmetsp:Transcript_13883/g.52844  ORF Transcript_13883/g.52844 Transcript_13883/m.52844 type:complete len:482 (+) Transcript_13883:885-2330(+)